MNNLLLHGKLVFVKHFLDIRDVCRNPPPPYKHTYTHFSSLLNFNISFYK